MNNINPIISNLNNNMANWQIVETLKPNETIEPTMNQEGRCQFKAVKYESKAWFATRHIANYFSDTKTLGPTQKARFQSLNAEISETLKNVKELKSEIQSKKTNLTSVEKESVQNVLSGLKQSVTKVLNVTYPMLDVTYKDRTIEQESGKKGLNLFPISKELDLEAYILANELLPEIDILLSKDQESDQTEQLRKNIDDALESDLVSSSDNSMDVNMRYSRYISNPSSLIDVDAPVKLRQNYYENFNNIFTNFRKMDSKKVVNHVLFESKDNKPLTIIFNAVQSMIVPGQFYHDIDRTNLFILNDQVLYDLKDQKEPGPSKDVIAASIYQDIVQELVKNYSSVKFIEPNASSASNNNNELQTHVKAIHDPLIQNDEDADKLATLLSRLLTQTLFADVPDKSMIIYSPNGKLSAPTGLDRTFNVTMENENIVIEAKLSGKLIDQDMPLESAGYYLFKRVITLPIKEALQVDLSDPDLKNFTARLKCKDIFSKKLGEDDLGLSDEVIPVDENGALNPIVKEKLAELLSVF